MKMPTFYGSATRYAELDLLRTLAIAGMVVYHTAFDLAFFYDFPIDPLSGGWLISQHCTVILFLSVVGVSFAISYGRMERRGVRFGLILKKYMRRGAGLMLCALLISGATYVAVGDQWIRFGALHLIGTAILLLPFLMPLREGNALLALGIFAFAPVVRGMSAATSLLLPLGIMPPGFASVDYLPIIPWMGWILLGAAVGNTLYNRRWLRYHLPQNRYTNLIALPGRHALLLYLLHQPILLIVLSIILGRMPHL